MYTCPMHPEIRQDTPGRCPKCGMSLALADPGSSLKDRGLGVAIKIAKKEPVKCVCLGTFLKIPLTNITLIEDFGMAGLALILLLF